MTDLIDPNLLKQIQWAEARGFYLVASDANELVFGCRLLCRELAANETIVGNWISAPGRGSMLDRVSVSRDHRGWHWTKWSRNGRGEFRGQTRSVASAREAWAHAIAYRDSMVKSGAKALAG